MDHISDAPIGFPINNIISLCHEYIDTGIYVLPVHVDIILLVVSDGDDSTECWISLFENPGVIEVHELNEVFVHSENHSLVHRIVIKRNVASGDNPIGTTVNALAKVARCRTFPDGLFSVYCSRPRGCASSTTSSSICFNTNGPMLSPTPRGSREFAWLINSRNGCRRGACCRRQRLQNCNSSHAMIVSCLS